MKQKDLFEALKSNPYPGRGIVLGFTPDGKKAALAYFIMGRSAGSRSRAFVKNGDDIGIHMLDGGKIADTSLILYAPLRTLSGATVVTNGDQTDTVCAAVAQLRLDARLRLRQGILNRDHRSATVILPGQLP